MNLHGIVAGAIGAINPFVPVTIQRSTGYTTAADGKRTPTYTTFTASVQVQALTFGDIRMLDGLNIEGVRRAVYMTGNVMAIVRIAQRGGDLLQFSPGVLPEGNIWLAAQALEQWPDWVKFCITLQNGA